MKITPYLLKSSRILESIPFIGKLLQRIVPVANYSNVLTLAHNLLDSKNHVWTQQYNISYLQPNRFSQIFYSEYDCVLI